jgi:hypothetical protein
MPLTRDKFSTSPKPPLSRRLGALVAALAVQGLALSMFIALDEQRYFGIAPEALSFTWLYLPPLVSQPVEPEVPTPVEQQVQPPEQPPEQPTASPAPETSPQPRAEEFRLEDLEIVSVPTLRVTPRDQVNGAAIRLGMRQYFSCNFANYDTLAEDEMTRCAERLASLRKERDLLDSDALPLILTAGEARLWRGWQRNLLERQAPLLLPCLNASGFLTINVASIDCLISSVGSGYDPDNNPPNRYGEVP